MADGDRSHLVDAAKRKLQCAAHLSNIAGATDVFIFAMLLFPVRQPPHIVRVLAVNSAFFVLLLAATFLFGDKLGARNTDQTRAWVAAGRDPTPAERDHALRLPFIQARLTARLWLVAMVVFTAVNLVLVPS